MLTINKAIALLEAARHHAGGEALICLDDASGYLSPFIAAIGMDACSEAGAVVTIRCEGDGYEAARTEGWVEPAWFWDAETNSVHGSTRSY